MTTAQIAQLNAAGIGATPKTVHVDGLGDFRAVSVRDPLGQTVISGIPITPVTDTVDRVITLVGGGHDRRLRPGHRAAASGSCVATSLPCNGWPTPRPRSPDLKLDSR